MSELESRIAVISGATSGIGEAIVRRFMAAGYQVVGNGRNGAKLEALGRELGGHFTGVAGDVTDGEIQEALFRCAQDRFGQEPDIVVVNAGRGLGGSVLDVAVPDFENVLKVNVTGAFGLLQKAAKRMVKMQRDAFPESAADVVVIGSVVGRHISPFSAVYGASKFALHALTEALRREVGPQGVRVTLVEPAVVLTGFQEGAGYSEDLVQGFKDRFGPLPESEDVADLIQHIVSLPAHIHLSDVVVRPTRQDYP